MTRPDADDVAIVPDEAPSGSARLRYVRTIAIVLGGLVFLIHAAMPVSLGGGDTLWSIPVVNSVVHEHNVDLNEYPDLARFSTSHLSRAKNGRLVFDFPWGPSIVSAPLVAVFDGWLHLHHTSMHEQLHDQFAPQRLEIRIASFYVALSTALLFLLLVRRTRRRGLSLFVCVVFAFGTSMLSTLSRALWSHTPSVLFSMLALYLLQVVEDHPEWRGPKFSRRGAATAGACGIAIGFTYFVRPTNAVIVVVLLGALVMRRVWIGVFAIAGAAIPIVTLVAINLATIDSPLQGYYKFNRAKFSNTYFEGLAGNLVSPARGLFVWSPILLLALPAAVRAVRRPGRDRLLTASVVVVVLYWLSISTLRPWWAGWSVGPRLFSDTLPFLMLLVADTVLTLLRRAPDARKQAQYAGVGVVVAFSLFTNIRAATHFSVQQWNFKPADANVDKNPDRPWDWSDPQFLR